MYGKINLLYLKILFPIEEKTESNKSYNKKLIIEMLFEIFIELYLEFKKTPLGQESFMFEALINDLFLNKASEFQDNKISYLDYVKIYNLTLLMNS